MGEPAEWLTVPVYALIAAGELEVEVIVAPGPRRRRQLRVTAAAVDDLVARSRIRPGQLRHLYPG